VATTIFHNLIRVLNGDEEWLDHQPDNINPTQFVALPSGVLMTQALQKATL
jgi:hypothetical protein